MATEPEFLVAKEIILVTLATVSVAIAVARAVTVAVVVAGTVAVVVAVVEVVGLLQEKFNLRPWNQLPRAASVSEEYFLR